LSKPHLGIATAEASGADQVAACLEQLPVSPLHNRARILVGGATFFNAVDGLALASVLPVLTGAWYLSLEQTGLLISAGYLGQLVGSFLFGWSADKLGRLTSIVYAVLTFSLLSVLCATSWGYWPLLILRAVQGIGLGGEVPIAAVYINELSAARRRGRFTLFYEWAYPLGRVGVSLAGLAIVTAWGWRYLFLVGGLPIILALSLRSLLPESPRWLASQGRIEEATAAVRQLSGMTMLPAIVHGPGIKTRRADWRELFCGIYLKRTLVAWALWFTAFWIVNGLTNWVSALYRTVFHLPVQQSLWYGLVANLASVAGCFAVACLIDRTGRRPWFTGALLAGGITFLVLWRTGATSALQVLVLTSIGLFCVNSVTVALYLHTAEVYPTRLRALGVGVASSWMRVSSIIGASVIGATAEHFGLNAVFLQLGLLCIVGAIVAAIFSVETTGRALEDVSP
jgi:MFS transporter, putative metabolite:H+ symporter